MTGSNKHITKTSGAILLSFALAVGVLTPAAPGSIAAAKKPSLAKASGKVLTGTSKTIKIKGVTKKTVKKLTVKSSKKAVAKVTKAGKGKKTALKITGKKEGSSKITATVKLKKGKTYKLKYSVKVVAKLTKSIPLITLGSKSSSTIKLTYYKDAPNVPYTELTDFYNRISDGHALSVAASGSGVYVLTEPRKTTAVLDTKKDTLTSDNYPTFGETSFASTSSVTYDGAPYLKATGDIYDIAPSSYTADFGAHGIDIKESGGKIYMPLSTAGVVFAHSFGRMLFSDGTNVYLLRSLFERNKILDTDYYDNIKKLFAGGVIPSDLAKYNYNNLCFMIDTAYGNPGRCYFSEAIESKGLDLALTETDQVTSKVKKLLTATKIKDYLKGIAILDNMLYDGGHTDLSDLNFLLYPGNQYSDYFGYEIDIDAYAKSIGYTFTDFEFINENKHNSLKDIKKTWNKNYYHTEGNTAVFTFDGFEFDAEAWNKYYKKNGDIPDDTFGTFMKSMKMADEDPNIENFILDLSANIGGSSDVVAAMMDVMCGDTRIRMKDRRTGGVMHSDFETDKNLDGVFDEKDDEVKYDLNFAALTTACSFSCGNLLPCLMKDHGMPIIGETSGGGSCTITIMPTGYGCPITLSTCRELITSEGVSVDGGATPNFPIDVTTEDDMVYDYSAYFDIPTLGNYVDKFYDNAG